MIRSVVALGGPPGSGKSTAGRQAAAQLDLVYRSVGDEFRAEAARRGMDLGAFGRYAQQHPEVDRELDRAMEAYAHPGTLLDGRIQGPLCRRRGVPVLVVVVTATLPERARRVAARDGQSIEAAQGAIEAREASERDRFARFYGIDLDREPEDLRIDSTELSVAEVVERLVGFLRRHGASA